MRRRFLPLGRSPLARSPRLLQELREYWKQTRPASFLFPGKMPDVPLSGVTIQKACKLAAALARINKPATPHTLRPATRRDCSRPGVDLLAIGRLLGHKSLTTTMIYL